MCEAELDDPAFVYFDFFPLQGPSTLMPPCNISLVHWTSAQLGGFHYNKIPPAPGVHSFSAISSGTGTLQADTLPEGFVGADFCAFVVN